MTIRTIRTIRTIYKNIKIKICSKSHCTYRNYMYVTDNITKTFFTKNFKLNMWDWKTGRLEDWKTGRLEDWKKNHYH